MKITKRQRDYIREETKVLETYKIVNKLEECDILHLYNTWDYWMFSDWFIDSMMFDLWAFNTKTDERTYLGIKDEICPMDSIRMIRVFADGSTLIRFNKLVTIWYGQSICFYEVNK